MALARILPRFDLLPDGTASLAAIFSAKPGEHGRAKALADAEESGFRKGIAAGRAELDARMAEERTAFAERLRSERARWIEEEAGAISAGWEETLLALQAKLSEAVATLLLPLIDTGLASKAVNELSGLVRNLLSQDKQPLIRVEGPDDLTTALRAHLGAAAASVEFAVTEGVDIRLLVGGSAIETQLQSWKERLSQALAGAANE